MSGFRVKALRRALGTSLLVPAVAGGSFAAQQAGVDLSDRRWLGFVLLALASLPTFLLLVSAGMGHTWRQLEKDWNGLEGWKRGLSSTVALVCGITTGAAVVLLALSFVELDARATEEPESPSTSSSDPR